MNPKKDYYESLSKIRYLISAYQKDGICKATTAELNEIVKVLEPIDFAAYGKEICALFNSKIGNSKPFPSHTNQFCSMQATNQKITFIQNNDGTSKYYPKYPDFLPSVLYP